MSATNDPSNKAEDIKGRVKEAAGVITGNDRIKNEGKADQASAGIKGMIHTIEEKVEDLVDDAKKAFQDRKGE